MNLSWRGSKNLSWLKARSFRDSPGHHLFGHPCGTCPHAAGWHRWLKAKAGVEPRISRKKTNCHRCPCTSYRDGLS